MYALVCILACNSSPVLTAYLLDFSGQSGVKQQTNPDRG